MSADWPGRLWDPSPGWLNTASYGLPPRPAYEALTAALDDWRHGRTDWMPWHVQSDRARAGFAELVGADASAVTIGASVSGLLAPVAAALPEGSRVVVPEVEFTSNLFPWQVHADRGVEVVTVPLRELPGAIDARTTLVAFSLVQSATGEIAPVAEVLAAAEEHSVLTSVDATQAAGWLPLDATRFDVVVAAAYKWLMAPRGAAFGYLSERIQERTRPLAAGWCAAEEPHSSYYGPMRLAESARRFDISPAWFSHVGAAASLRLINDIGVKRIRDHNVRLANRFLTELGEQPGDSAIVTVDRPGAAEALAGAGVRTSVRGGRVRASFHVYTTDADVDLALEALRPLPR
ncbi:aminotransferase class V-fold PLP-dependent enzyme [Allonocardiopsis opalescens]|nr:aminotransferase class V-fold PLP-dependent enzyme [Allonocardiopsis opalescens]